MLCLNKLYKRYPRRAFANYYVFIIGTFAIAPVSGQTMSSLKATHKEDIVQGIYREEVLETFEKIIPLPRNIITFSAGQPLLEARTDFPSPRAGSNRYITLTITPEVSNRVRFQWDKPLVINGFARELRLWVYSTQLPGNIAVLVQDSQSNVHLLSFGTLNFRGWQEMSVSVPDFIFQSDLYPRQNSVLKVLAIQYEPGRIKRRRARQLLSIDDLTVITRAKYKLPQSSGFGGK